MLFLKLTLLFHKGIRYRFLFLFLFICFCFCFCFFVFIFKTNPFLEIVSTIYIVSVLLQGVVDMGFDRKFSCHHLLYVFISILLKCVRKLG